MKIMQRGVVVASQPASDRQSCAFAQVAALPGRDFPVSCCAGPATDRTNAERVRVGEREARYVKHKVSFQRGFAAPDRGRSVPARLDEAQGRVSLGEYIGECLRLRNLNVSRGSWH